MIVRNILLLFCLYTMALGVFAQADSTKQVPEKIIEKIAFGKDTAILKQSDRFVNYKISALLNPNDKVVTGDMELSWKNYSTDTIQALQFHMYLNAFQNSKSTFFREQSNGFSMDKGFYPEKWGHVRIVSIKVKGGAVLTDGLHFIQPDDNNKDDQTVANVPLKTPIIPGERVILEIKFESQLPSIVARTGFHDNFFMVAQWFPKIAVYEPAGWRYSVKGHWNCHQFHANSEFYANFGNYDVDITVPNNYIVGASGTQVGKPTPSNGMKTVVYHARDVVDFAWTAYPEFDVYEEQWKHVKLRLLLSPNRESLAKRYFHSAKATLAYFEKHLGEYPYESLTLVDPPYGADEAGGMEYPNLVTLGGMALPNKLKFLEDDNKYLEIVTVHEVGHQYFMGLLASNEFEEPWLDEGFNSYWENRIMDAVYGKKTSYIDNRLIKVGDSEWSRLRYTQMKNHAIAENFRTSWDFPSGSYGDLTYYKTSTWLETLHNLIGDEAMSEVWRTYYQEWRFRHPNANSFIAIVNRVVPKHHKAAWAKDMNWFFRQFLMGTAVCDYAVEDIKNGLEVPEHGVFFRKGVWEEIDYTANKTAQKLVSKVSVHRLGTAVLPVEVLVHFEDGSEELLNWDGKAPTRTFVFTDKKAKVLWAKVDPDNKLTMDINRINNSYTLEPSRRVFAKYLFKATFWLQNIFELFAMLA